MPTLCAQLGSTPGFFFVGVRVAHCLVLYSVVSLCFVCIRTVSCVSCVSGVVGVSGMSILDCPSVFSNIYLK